MPQSSKKYGAEILTLFQELQSRRPDATVLSGDVLDLMRRRHPEITGDTLRTAVSRLKRQGLIEHLGPSLYRLPPQ
ncbi:hypothetical protein [Deinococcus hopiensis]|uniref:Uncharacterized protein n=1 Tax=Deinococcus hopiensis KR-140 TaxID=695939 RepID=A0A1W1URN3_9DEIO|nr:hypothetical protein [Deinococcus hopiensis]SMB83374.1 hypothetical protein SAMN00790413_04393 [Deinococcus hopiensis KR-140]